MTDDALVQVVLLQVPIEIWQRASAHQEAIQREFDILMAELPTDSIPHQLAALISDLDVRFQGAGSSTWDDLHSAAKRGDSTIDLVFEVPLEAAAGARSLDEVLDKVDEFCRAGEHLLTLATPPELVSFRRWFLGEFSRQIDQGLPPSTWSWSGPSEGALESEPADGSTTADARSILFEGDLDLATAGALRDEILAARSSGATSLVLDLTGVRFMDSVGLSLLVSAHNRLVEEGAEMQVLLPEQLRSLFEIAGLTESLRPEFLAPGSSRPDGVS